MTDAPSGDEASSGPSARSPPEGTNYVKKKVEDFGIALPARAAVAVLEAKAGIDDADEIHAVIEYLRNHDVDVAVIEYNGTVANPAWNGVELEWENGC
jgi:hypothetical protein